MSLLENSGFGQICNAKAKGRSNEGEECYFIEKKVDVGRGCSEPKSSGGKSSEWGRFLPELLGWWVLVGDAGTCFPVKLKLKVTQSSDRDPMGCTEWRIAKNCSLGQTCNTEARTREWAASPVSRASFRPRNRTWVSCINMRVLYCLSHQESP